MPGPAASATSVGAGSPRGGGTSSPRAGGGGGARQRKGTSSSGAVRTTRAGGTSSGGMWRFYTDDSPGIKVGFEILEARSHFFIKWKLHLKTETF